MKKDKQPNKLHSWFKEYFVGYRKQFWYIVSMVLTFLSVAVMLISMLFMYLGSNAAVAWFIVACPVLVFGILTAVSTKKRYEEAIAFEREPIPMFWHIRYVILLLREFIARHGLLRFIFIALTSASLIVTIVFGGICGHYYLERDDIRRNIDYISNDAMYDEYKALWEESYLNGDNESAAKYFEIMEEYQSKNAPGFAQIKEFTKSLNENLLKLGISAIITAFLSVVLIAYILRQRRLNTLNN